VRVFFFWLTGWPPPVCAGADGGRDKREKTEIGGNMGYTGLFRDTEGNVNGVWSQK
jgi:hypothetical protein